MLVNVTRDFCIRLIKCETIVKKWYLSHTSTVKCAIISV